MTRVTIADTVGEAFFGRLLKNQKARDAHSAWNRPNLQSPQLLTVVSPDFTEGGAISLESTGKHVGGKNISPTLTWSQVPPATVQLLLVVEDLDVPLPKPAVHALALINPVLLAAPDHLPKGGLDRNKPAAGVRVLRSTLGSGYHGPEPIKGHGPHRYTFQIFALSQRVGTTADEATLDRVRPRILLASITSPVIARGRITGTYKR